MNELKPLADWVYGGDVKQLLDQTDDFRYYDCSNMTELAGVLLEDSGVLDAIPDDLRFYFDYEKYGRDLEINGSFLTTSNGIFECIQ